MFSNTVLVSVSTVATPVVIVPTPVVTVGTFSVTARYLPPAPGSFSLSDEDSARDVPD